MATLERVTERKVNVAFVSCGSQTDDSGPRHLHSSSCQTSGESGRLSRDDSMLSGISAIEADYAKKVCAFLTFLRVSLCFVPDQRCLQTERAISSISKTFKHAHEKSVAKFVRQVASRQAADVGAALTKAISHDILRVKENLTRGLNLQVLDRLAGSLSDNIEVAMDSEAFRNVVMEASEGFVAAVDALASSVIDKAFISWSHEVSAHPDDVDDVLRQVGKSRLHQLEVVRLRLKDRRDSANVTDAAPDHAASHSLRVHFKDSWASVAEPFHDGAEDEAHLRQQQRRNMLAADAMQKLQHNLQKQKQAALASAGKEMAGLHEKAIAVLQKRKLHEADEARASVQRKLEESRRAEVEAVHARARADLENELEQLQARNQRESEYALSAIERQLDQESDVAVEALKQAGLISTQRLKVEAQLAADELRRECLDAAERAHAQTVKKREAGAIIRHSEESHEVSSELDSQRLQHQEAMEKILANWRRENDRGLQVLHDLFAKDASWALDSGFRIKVRC